MQTNQLTLIVCAFLTTVLWCDQHATAEVGGPLTHVIPTAPVLQAPTEVLQAPEQAQKAAQKGKLSLEELTRNDDRHAQELGFASAAQAADMNTALGDPLPRFLVPLDRLKVFNPNAGIDPRSLLQPAPDFIYPITVGTEKEVVSSLVVEGLQNPQGNMAWHTTEWGGAILIRLLHKYRTSATNIVVWLPALNRYFLGQTINAAFLIVPIADEPRLGFKAGQAISATTAFAKLLSEAKANNESPR